MSSRQETRRLASLASHVTNNARSKVVVCRDLGPEVMPRLRNRNELDLVVWPENRQCDREWLLKNISGAAGVVVMLSDKVNSELLDKAGSNLRVVSTMSVGYEHVDLSALSQRKIKLGYTPDVLTEAVADLSVMLALMAGRMGKEALSVVHNGQWPNLGWAPFGFCGPQLSTMSASQGRTVGFIGLGRIAQATLTRLVSFGVNECIYTGNPSSPRNTQLENALLKEHPKLKSIRRVELDELAKESDVLFILAPGGATTKHLVNKEFLAKMKKTAVLVNTSRGTLVDSDALANVLRDKQIWGAGLDVVEGEPDIRDDHPLVKEPRCVVLPHIASATIDTRLGMASLAVNNLLAGISGKDLPAGVDLTRIK